jgi:hypothetical protein
VGRPNANPFAAFGRADQAVDVAYALDDGMPFPDWTPPLLTTDEAEAGYAAGERFAVIAGDPANPTAGLVLDRRNQRLALRLADPPLQLVYDGEPLALTEALWTDAEGQQCWARRASDVEVRVARRPIGALVWVEELLARREAGEDANAAWPDFGDWPALAALPPAPWTEPDGLELMDADGWLLDAWEACGVTQTWRELGKKYDAPRAFGLPPDVQAKLAAPLGWQPAGRRWRKADEIAGIGGKGATVVTVVTDAMFAAGAGASGEVVTTVTAGKVQIALGLPVATARLEIRRGERLGSPSYPRPSTGAQVAVTAMLEAGGVAHAAAVQAVRDGHLPAEWASAFG